MDEVQELRLWLRWLPWAQSTDTKVRNWIQTQRLELKDNLRSSIKEGSLAHAVFNPLLDGDRPALPSAEDMEKLRFQTSARIGETVFRSCASVLRRLLGATVHELQLEAGTLRYWKTETGKAETVLFFHGFGDSMDGIYPFALHLRKDFNLIVPDLPGFGQSFKRRDLPHTYETYAVWIEEFAKAAKLKRVHVVGNSLGGAFALILAQKCPELVASVTLINSAAITDFKNPSVYDEFMAGKILFQVTTVEEFDKFWARIFHRPPLLPPFVKDFLVKNFRENHEWYGYLISQLFAEIPGKKDPRYKELFLNQYLAKLKVPTLILWGANDSLFPVSFGQRGHKLLRNSRLIVLEGVGHAPQVEAPGLVAAHLREFIQSLKAGTSAS